MPLEDVHKIELESGIGLVAILKVLPLNVYKDHDVQQTAQSPSKLCVAKDKG